MIKKGLFLLIVLVVVISVYRNINRVEIDYFPSGEIKTKHITNRITGKLKIINYFENSNIEEELTYKSSGFIHGSRQYYLHGTYFQYYPTGELKIRSNYKNGMLNGPEIEYYKNGSIYNMVYFEYDTIVGDGKVYYDDGTLKAINKYKDNRAYYIKLYPKNEQDSTESLIPIIDVSGTGGRIGDTITCKMMIYSEDTPFKTENFVINYDVLLVSDDLDLLDFPRPRYDYHFENGIEKTARFVIENDAGADYFYGYLAEKTSSNVAKAHRDFFILIPKDSFSISFPSNDTTYVKMGM